MKFSGVLSKITLINREKDELKKLTNKILEENDELKNWTKIKENEINELKEKIKIINNDNNYLENKVYEIENEKEERNIYYNKLFLESDIIEKDERKLISKWISPYII